MYQSYKVAVRIDSEGRIDCPISEWLEGLENSRALC